MNHSQKVVRNTGYQLIFKLITILSSFVLRTAFIYTLGDEYTGLSSLFHSVLKVLSFVELGMGSSIIFALYKPIAHKDDHKIAQLMRIYRIAYVTIGIVIFALGSCLVPFLDQIITNVPNVKENLTAIYVWQLANTMLSYFLVHRVSLLNASENEYIVSRVDSILYILRTVFELLVLIIFHSYWAFLIVNTVYNLSRNLILTGISRKRMPLPKLARGDYLPRDERRGIFKNVGALAIYKISDVALEGTDSILISSMLGTNLLGIYSNYYLLMTTVKYAIDQVFSSSVPSIGNFKEFNDTDSIETIFKRLTFLSFWMATFATAAFLCLIDFFIADIWLTAERVLPFGVVLAIFIEFYLCLMSRPSRTIRDSCGLFVQGKWRPVIMAIINIVSSVILTIKLGLIGVILGTIIARVTTQFWFDPYVIYKHLFKRSPKQFFIGLAGYVVVSAAICTVTLLVVNLITLPNAFVQFVLKAIAVVIIPNGILLLLYRKNDHFQWLYATLKRLLFSKLKRKSKATANVNE